MNSYKNSQAVKSLANFFEIFYKKGLTYPTGYGII